MAVITISRQFGAGGKTLGKMIGERLRYTFADNNIIQQIAKEAKVSTNWVESFEKEAGSRMTRFVSKMVSQPLVERVLKNEYGYLDEQIYLDYLVLIIARMADEGNTVILGRGSQYILKGHPDTFHFLLVNSIKNRIKFMMENYGLSEKDAAALIRNEDKRRMNLYSKLGKQNYDRPELYHLVINREHVGLEEAANIICRMVEKK